MNVYYLISYDIDDPEGYRKYPEGVLPLFDKYGAEVLASDTDAMVMEGTLRTMNAVVKFPSWEAALACYHDPEYERLKNIRLNTTSNGSIVLAKGIAQG